MKKNRKLISFYLLLTIIILNYSCQNSNDRSQFSRSNEDNSGSAIDTSLWLKETRGIRDVLEDSKGNLWFSSPDYIAKSDGTTLYYFSEADGLNIVGNLHEDINGTIWVEDGFEISRYDGKRFVTEKLEHKLISNGNKNGLWIQRSLSPTDTAYVAPGIYKFNQESSNFFPYPLTKNANNKYSYFPTTKSYLGKDSTVWAGTMEKVFGLKNNTFLSIGREEMGRRNDPRQMGIRGIFVDSKGKLWIADNGAGVFMYDGKETENFTRKHHLDEGDTEGSTLHRAFSIAEDSFGNMWFGTVYSGIWKYNPETNEFKNYTKDDGVLSENIWTIYKTKNGKLLFAGESPSAVYLFNGKGFNRKY